MNPDCSQGLIFLLDLPAQGWIGIPGALAEAGEPSHGHFWLLSGHPLPALTLSLAFEEKILERQEAVEFCVVPQPLLAFRLWRGPAEACHCPAGRGGPPLKICLTSHSSHLAGLSACSL